ncbi:AarF/ABC1/UbiB kinase family protein [Acidovorax lacteus]|uniref:AarF/ABC1/UbiB kinase family protein n=1 Tax=Acidovorax lacteus TaxID=1924988 RepID=A0ABP8L8R2_9BURK
MAAANKPSAAPGDASSTAAVPSGRIGRLARMGGLATGLASGMVAEGLRRWSQGDRPSARELLLTPANARRVADQLAQLRGAAMKVGQLLSMDAGELLPPELSDILARLRSDAKPMPLGQMDEVLTAAWGAGWDQRFAQFGFTPIAAASIGQVHRARMQDGRDLAIKVQYPGIARSIDSDVDNVALLLRMSGLLPRGLDVAPLLAEAKRQLHEEADYRREAECLERFAALLQGDDAFVLPRTESALCGPTVLAMDYLASEPLESLAHADAAQRDAAATQLLRLLFRELFEFGWVQTDPNFANYRVQPGTGRIVLLDFGATRRYGPAVAGGYQRLLRAARDDDRAGVAQAAEAIGYFGTAIVPAQREAVVDLFLTACEPLRTPGAYDFGASDLAARIRDAGMALSMERDFWHTPPADAIFLHRKLGGLYLLAARLKARVPVQALVSPWLDGPAPAAQGG